MTSDNNTRSLTRCAVCQTKSQLLHLKHSYDLSDEGLCERWLENPSCQA
jgi:hypothetical protein